MEVQTMSEHDTTDPSDVPADDMSRLYRETNPDNGATVHLFDRGDRVCLTEENTGEEPRDRRESYLIADKTLLARNPE